MPPASRPQWQQATALISIGAGSLAGLTIVPKAAADLTTPASIPPVTLLALEHANAPVPGRDGMLRAAIVHMARHFQRLAETRSPAEMEALIWQHASTDGANHGPSCAAFASLTLELGSHIAGLDSWVTGGTSYPWPVHSWVDGRVDPNPASPGVVSILQDAQSHGRWHPLGDGYTPQPGDWVLFDGHVEVVTSYQGGVLHTIGGDSMPNLSVNAHEYAAPLQGQGVAGFVDNGVGMSKAPGGAAHAGGGGHHARAAAKTRGPRAAPMAGPDPTPSGVPSSSAVPVPGGPVAGGAAAGGSASGGARGGARSSAAPVPSASGPAQAPELAPRAVAAPRTVPQPRYAQESRPLPEQGARRGAPSGDASRGGAARAARAPAEPRQHANRPGTPASGTGRAAHPIDQPSQLADRSPQPSGRSPGRADRRPQHGERRRATADVPATGLRPARPHHARPGEAAIPGLFNGVHRHHQGDGGALAPYHRHDVAASDAPLPGTSTQQAFINAVASGAVATQRRYGVPASVTIAQAIDESGWGQSLLATSDHNLFGIKGTGPAGTDVQPTQEVINGQLVNLSASFQVYANIAQSIDAHARLLARSGDYAGAMAQSKDPNAFAAALTGVYATDPSYGAKLVQLMQQYDLYRFDRAASQDRAPGSSGGQPAAHHPPRTARGTGAKQTGGKQHPASTPPPPASPEPRQPLPGRGHKPDPQQPGPIGNPVPVQPEPVAEPVAGQPAPIANPVPAEPGPRTGPRSRAYGGQPAHGTKTGASAAIQRPGTPPAGRSADHAQAVHHDAVTPPAAVLYPGRSARPAPLAHPARPTDLARPSSAAPGPGRGATPARPQAQQPGLWPDPAPATSPSDNGTGSHHPARHGSPVLGPASGAESGQANISGDAAIPGVAHAVTPQARRAHTRRPIGRLRPAHPAYRSVPPTSPPQHPGATAAGSASSRQAGGAIIPGIQHHGPAAHVTTGLSGSATAPDGAVTMTSQPGGSSIPGVQQSAGRVSATRVASAGIAASPGHSSTPPPIPAAASDHPSAGPLGEGVSPGRPASRAALHRNPATEPTRPAAPAAGAASPGNGAAEPGQPAARPTQSAARQGEPSERSARIATTPGEPARQGGGTNPSTGPASAGRAAGSAEPGPSPAAPQGHARPVPAPANRGTAAAKPAPTAPSTPSQGGADVAGLVHAAPARARTALAGTTALVNAAPPARTPRQGNSPRAPGGSRLSSPAPSSSAGATLTVYHAHMPPSVRQTFLTSAKTPLVRAEPLYRDVASHTGIRWEILAACDWMQCKARHGYSPVYGEKLGALNPDDTCYRTKSAALEQCASDLVQLAGSVYHLDIATDRELTIRELANVFAAYRWGGLLKHHCTSAMDFPYSVAGLTADHTHMRWPNIDEPNAPDKPGGRFRQSFGAVPVVLSLNYQALM